MSYLSADRNFTPFISMIAIAVDTPSQLIAALLAYQRVGRGEPIVLFGRHGLETNGRHPSIERMLYYGDEHMTPSRLLSGLMSPLTILRTIPGYDPALDITAVIASRTSFIATYLQKEYAERHPFLPVYLIESGPDEYYENTSRDRFSGMCALMKQPTHLDFVSRGFLSVPDLYPFERPYPIEQLPKSDLETHQVLGPMLGRPPRDEREALMSRFLIFFESAIPRHAASGDTFDVIAADSRVLSAACRAVGARNITVVSNGRRDMPYERDVAVMQPGLPFESFLFRNDFNWKILMSRSLGVLSAPKLYFDQEPFLIYTGVLDGENTDKKQEAFFNDFSRLYSQKKRCAVPGNLMELKDVLSDFARTIERS